MRRLVIGLLTALAVLVPDQITKHLVSDSFELWESRPVIDGFFSLTYVHNTGAAFGFLHDHTGWQVWFFVGVAMLAMCFIIWLLLTEQTLTFMSVLGLGMIMGGAAGNNLFDRIRFGHVIDFLDFYVGDLHWPAFNVADSAITVGAGLLILAYLRGRDHASDPD